MHINGAEAQYQLRAILETSTDAIIRTTTEGIVIGWNIGAERSFEYTVDEAAGRPISLLSAPDRDRDAETLQGAIARGERLEAFETFWQTKSGRRCDVSLNVSPIKDSAGRVTGALTIAQDNTERRRTRRALERLEESEASRALVLETASRVALDILAHRNGVEALQHIAAAARALAHARYAALGVAHPDGRRLIEFVTVGLTPEKEAMMGPRPRGAGVLGLLLTRTEPLRIDDISEHPAAAGFPPNHPRMTTFLGVPIRRGDTILGSLYLTDKEGGGSFTEEDEVAVQALGAHAAVAIHNLQMLSRQRALVSGLIAAQEEERRAVAYDLHDGLTQYVMASHAHLESFRRAHEAGRHERAARELDQGLRYLKEAVVESRRLVNGLRSLALDDLGLAGALEQLHTEEKARAGWTEADFIHNIAGRRFDKALETAVYRVAQEALTNARKHAETTRLRLLLLAGADERTGAPQLTLEVRDWGKGFVPEETVEEYGHLGLQSMQERVRLMEGTYALQSAPGEGTLVHAVFPALEPQEDVTEGRDL